MTDTVSRTEAYRTMDILQIAASVETADITAIADAQITAASRVINMGLTDAPGTASNIDRYRCGSNLSALTTQVMLSVALPLKAGFTVTSLTFMSATTQAGTPTNWWFALHGPDLQKIAQTADQTSAAWAANTAKTLALSAPHTVTADAVYWASIMVKASTPPTLVGTLLHHANVSGDIGTLGYTILAQNSGTSLTTTAPNAIATATTVATVPLVIAS